MLNEQSTWLDKIKSYFSNQNENHSYRNISLVVGLILLSLASFFVYNSIVYKTQVSEFDITASASDIAGVAQNSHFIVKTTVPLSTQVLEKYVKITPETAFSIEKVSAMENTFEIIPKEELKVDQIYTIQVDKGPLASRDFSWAYQVKAPFQITSSIPGDKGVGVPVNTGIEIYFNRDTIIDPEKFIEITPPVQGKFDVSETKVQFVPSSPLTERTIYTVKIKAGLHAKDSEDTFTEDKIIQFQTSESNSVRGEPSVHFTRDFSEFKPESNITLGVSADYTDSASVTVYRFNTSDEFLTAVQKINGNTPWARYYAGIDTQLPDSKKVFSGDIPIETYNYSSLIRLPQSLQTGYYAAVVTAGKNKDIAWFQVNPVASFVAFSSLKSLFWLKSMSDEKNVSGSAIVFNNTQVGQTGTDGVALISTPAELIKKSNDSSYRNSERKFFIAKIPTGDLVIPVENEYGFSSLLSRNETWWNYISTNKNIYLPTDVIRFWAVQKLRSGEKTEKEISVKLTNPFWDEYQKDVVTYAETKLQITDYNAITGELSYANLKPGIYELTFRNGEEIIGKTTVTIGAYIKPAYKIIVTPNKDTVFAGDTVTYHVKAEFFDKTPVSNIELSYNAYSGYGKSINGNVTLNAQGEATFTVVPKYDSIQTSWPSYLSVNVSPTKAEEGQIETSSSFVYVFGPHISSTFDQKRSVTSEDFTIKTRTVIPVDTITDESFWNKEGYLGGPVVGVTTKVDVTEIIYVKNQTGTGYDAINKISYPIYTYKTEEKLISSENVTSDQGGISKFSFSPESAKTYKCEFTIYDSIGRVEKETRYVYRGLHYGDITSYDHDTRYYLHNSDINKRYKNGDQINLQLQNDQGVLPQEGKEDYIFMTVNNGTIEYKVQDSPKYNAVFQNKDIPNIGIWPGWFSDGHFHNSYLENISYDSNERKLNIVITKNKQTYKPGDVVSLDIKVTDKNNNPVQAEINLSALDEAVFSVSPSVSNIANDIYRNIYSQVVIRTSNMPPYGGGGAEKGGGEGDGPRSNIQEMAIFKSINSDANGYAHVEFKLPDNLTSWRLTSQAVTKDLFAGENITFIPVALPFFVDATLNASYLLGDQLVLRLRSFGTSMNKEDIKYTVESPTLSFKTITKVGGSIVEIPLGILQAGIHQLTMRASNGTFTDALVRPLKVVSSYFTKNVSDFYNGSIGLKIKNNSTGYTTLTFNSYGKGLLYSQIKSLTCQCGLRLDQKGSARIATDLLNTFFGEKNELPDFQATKYQSYSGGLQLLPYSSDDLELSAISAHLFDSSVFDTKALESYFNSALSDKKSDISRISLALYGLSAFHSPVLTKIESVKNNKSLTIKDKVYIALALDSLGAKEEARTYYKQMIKPSLEIKPSYAYINSLKGDEIITVTTLVTTLTTSLEEPESAPLAKFVEENQPKETLNNFQRLLYIKSALSRLSSENVTFTYKVGAKEENKTLVNNESFELTLSPEDMSTFELLKIKGKLGIVATYEQQSSPDKVVKDSNLSLSRSYEVEGVAKKEFKEGDLIKVKLLPVFTSNSLEGAYQIVDYLPSGLRPLDMESNSYNENYGERVYPAEINDQKVTFVIDKNTKIPIYYYARVVSKGTYKAESALLQSVRALDSMTISHEESIIIQ